MSILSPFQDKSWNNLDAGSTPEQQSSSFSFNKGSTVKLRF